MIALLLAIAHLRRATLLLMFYDYDSRLMFYLMPCRCCRHYDDVSRCLLRAFADYFSVLR